MDKVLLIKSIEVTEVSRDWVQRAHFNRDEPMYLPGSKEPPRPAQMITYEDIKGEIFSDPSGRTVCIGMSKQVQEAIGLPFKVFDNMREEIAELRELSRAQKKHITKYRGIVDQFASANFWQRLKYLFT